MEFTIWEGSVSVGDRDVVKDEMMFTYVTIRKFK